jgi:hypothetical protein
MRTACFFPPEDLLLSSEEIADHLNDFDWRKLPEYPIFHYHRIRRKHLSITFTDLGYESLNDHCEYYEKSFSTAIMQALVILGFYEAKNYTPACLGGTRTAESPNSAATSKDD